MAYIYSAMDVRKGNFPTVQAFDRSAEQFRAQVANQPWCLGGMFYGSFTSGNHHLASDLDVFIVCPLDEFIPASVWLGEIITSVALVHKVHINCVLGTDDQLQTAPEHLFETGMWRHLERVATSSEAIIRENPLEYADLELLNDVDPQEELQNYLHRTVRKIADGLQAPVESEGWYDLARVIFDRPLHAARRFVNWKCPSLSGYTDTSEGLVPTFCNSLQGTEFQVELTGHLRDFIEMKRAYSNYLAGLVETGLWQSPLVLNEYLECIKRIRDHSGKLWAYILHLIIETEDY